MLSSNKYTLFYLAFFLFTCAQSIEAQNIDVVFTGIRSTEGQIIINIFSNEKNFDEGKPVQVVKFKKKNIVSGVMVSNFSLEPGVYGFCLVDDENNDNDINYGFLGIPKEGFGFSNYYLSGLKKPKFEKFKFVLSKDQKQKIYMKIRYM